MSVTNTSSVPPPTLSTLRLGWLFFKIGMTAFGGLAATLALIDRELVDRRRVLTSEQITEALTFTKPLPGSTVVQVVSYLGYRLGGWHGSALSTAAFLTIPMFCMIGAAGLYSAVHTLPGFSSVMKGLVAAVVGLMLSTTFRLGSANVTGLVPLAIALAAFTAAVRFQINAALIVMAAGLFGLLFMMPSNVLPLKERDI